MADPVTQLYCIGSVVGPHPFPMMVRDFQRVVGIEAREQFFDMTGDIPDVCWISMNTDPWSMVIPSSGQER